MIEWTPKGGVSIKAWTEGVEIERPAIEQLEQTARLPIIAGHIAVMPDVHFGKGATVGSVIPTQGAIIPAAVGVDIGCGMTALGYMLRCDQVDDLPGLRAEIESVVPVGRTANGKINQDKGAWHSDKIPGGQTEGVMRKIIADEYARALKNHPKAVHAGMQNHLGTLGGGNHFIEICSDENAKVWAVLHSGSRGPGNKIGTYFIEKAQEAARKEGLVLPNSDLAFLRKEHPLFKDYWKALSWAQSYASYNRQAMLRAIGKVMQRRFPGLGYDMKIDCHHNYATIENHFGKDIYVTRKGALRAASGDYGIIPGSMGTCSYIVQGKGNAQSFMSCSHGAGRRMSRGEAKRTFTLEDHLKATEGVECRKDAGVLDETPRAYKNIEAVMAAQADLVEVTHLLKQFVCIKG